MRAGTRPSAPKGGKAAPSAEDKNILSIKSEEILALEPGQLGWALMGDDVPHLQVAPSSITAEIGDDSSQIMYADHKGYFTTFSAEMDFIVKLESMVQRGQDFVHMLYTYRSLSQAIPEISIEVPADVTAEEEEKIQTKKHEINRKIMDILRPEIVKLKELMTFVVEAIGMFHGCVLHLTNKEVNKEQVPEGIHFSLVKLLDVLIKLDYLKDTKGSLQKDFSRYKRVVGSQPSIEVLEELSQLQSFLSSPDPRKSKGYIFTTLRDDVKRVRGHENILLTAIELAMESLEDLAYMLPDEKFRLVRVLPYLVLLVDGELDDAKGMNVFKTNKIKLPILQKVFKRTPVVPLFGDMIVTLAFILEKSPHYDKKTMASNWGGDPDPKTVAQYDLRSYWDAIRSSYSQYMLKFAAAMNRNEKYPFKKVLDEASLELANDAYSLVLDGFQKLSRWTSLLQQTLAWKYGHPCSMEDLQQRKVDVSVDGLEYARVLRHNLSKQEISVIVDVISMIKSMSAMLSKAEATLAPYVRFHIHHRIQQLAQGDLTPLLHRLDKRNKPILPSMLKIRSLAADWLGGHEPRKDYKEYSRKQGAVFAKHPARVVSASATQLYMLRTQVRSLYDSSSEVRRRSSMFGKADLEKTDIDVLARFNLESFYFPYMLSYAETLRMASDLGDLWYREFFLEMTKSIQFPIEMSMPWILTEHLILHRVTNAPMIENVLYVLDIYNDAAYRSLYILNQQYLYDEVEAEANLVIDQLYFILSDEIYSYYKNSAASSLLEKSMKHKLEELKSTELRHLTVEANRFESLLNQKHIQLLGRSINFSYILAQNITNKLFQDIEFAVKRFESSDAGGVIDLQTFLEIIRETHARLACHLEIDSFESMLSEVNESYCPTSFRGRISLHMLRALVNDAFPNYSYNYHTERFVRSPIPIRPMQFAKAPKASTVAQAYGSVCSKTYENVSKLTRGFFGRLHIDAFLSLGIGATDLTMIVDQCMNNLADKLRNVSEYLDALKEGVPPCKFPPYLFKVTGSYGFYEGKLKALLAYDDLKPEVFQDIREIGNTIAFLKLLSDAIVLSEQFDFINLAPFVGATPDGVPDTSGSVSNGAGNPDSLLSRSPMVAIVTHFAAMSTTSEVLANEMVRSSNSVSRLTSMITRMAENTAQFLDNGTLQTNSKTLFKWVLYQIEDYLYQFNLTTDWAIDGGHRQTENAFFGIEFEKARGFYRLWSALSFLFCITESDSEVASMAETVDTGISESYTLSNEAEFGHGFALAGCVFLHLLGQRNTFELMDFSYQVLAVNTHENRINGEDNLKKQLTHEPEEKKQSAFAGLERRFSASSSNKHVKSPLKDGVDLSLVKDTIEFVNTARAFKDLQTELFCHLEAQYTPRPSYLRHAVVTTTFHPPKED